MSTITTDQISKYASAAHDVYADQNVAIAGSSDTPIHTIKNPDTGFFMDVYLSGDGDEYIFSFRGTEDATLDLYADIQLGLPQWNANREEVLDLLSQYNAENPSAIFHFTGHSLGGGLAQYASYEYALLQMKPENNLTAQSDLVTFNALGGELGLEQMNEGGLSQAVLDSINAAHYRINSDPISRLGNNHIGGPLITLDVDVSGAIYAHGMAHFTDVGDLPALTE